jgi:hypothetical protein
MIFVMWMTRHAPRALSLMVPAVLCASQLSGCALFAPSPKTQGAGGLPLEATAGVDPDVTPFILEVMDEKNDGRQLVVKGRIIPKTTKPAAEVVVRLSALDRKGEQRVTFHNMQDLLAGDAKAKAGPLMLENGVARSFTLAMPLQGITNYQLEVLWGQDATPYAPSEALSGPQKEPQKEPKKESKQFIALRNLEVHRVPTESCVSPNECVVRFTITGELFNSGGATIKEVVIEAGFGTADNLDLQSQILENEKRVEVPNLRLAPGASQRFKVSLDKLVPTSAVVAPQPLVRIASFRSE